MPLHSLELLPDAAGTEVVLRDWQALRDAGLPSQLDHRGMTNVPHLTLVAAASLEDQAAAFAVERIGPLLPIRARVAGLLLLGGRRLTVARAIDVGEDLLAAVLEVRASVGDPQHEGWLPHITLARRVRREDAQRAIDVLGYADRDVSLTALRRWNAEDRSVTALTSI